MAMSRQKPDSVLDMPVTPLLEPEPGQENPFSGNDVSALQADSSRLGEEETPASPRNLNTDPLDLAVRRKKRFACSGILLLGLVIVVALIIVAVKQTETGPVVEEEDQREEGRMETTTMTAAESYQARLLRLYKLVTECHSLVQDSDQLDCKPFLAAATNTTVDTLIQNLANLIQDIKLNQTVEHINKFQSALENLDISEDVNNTNYKTILEILQPVIREQNIPNPQPRSSFDDGQKTFVSSLLSSSNSSGGGGLVVCDWRERRCRDGLKCYLTSQHCDLNVDCQDNSDEDDCDCEELLVGSRLCDGYLDCQGGHDETDCNCPPGTSFFCGEDSSVGPRCVTQAEVCDGALDCLTGRDEEDCTILAPSLNTISPRTASDHGYLSVWREDQQRFLPLAVLSNASSLGLGRMVQQSCLGVRGSQPAFSQVQPPAGFSGELALLSARGDLTSLHLADSLSGAASLVSVDCGNKQCGEDQAARVRREDSTACQDWIRDLTDTELDNLIASNGTYRSECCLVNERSAGDPRCVEARIVGGEVSYPDSWPSTVAIYRDGVFICGGSIISPDWILTAAHCVYGHETGYFYNVRTGMVRRQSQSPWEQQRHLEQVFLHPSYDNLYLRHDIALVRLNRPLNINRRVQEICLPADSSMSPGSGDTCIAAGWGDLSEDGPSSEQLRHVEIPVLASCGNNYNNINYQICGGHTQGGQDACQGDSGGPLYCRDNEAHWYLGGVISHGKGCARADEAGVYVRLAYYLTWIHDVMSGQLSPGTPSLECPGLQCGSGECVPTSWVCDLKVDCLDGGDVRGCVRLLNGSSVQLAEISDQEVTDLVTAVPGTGVEFDYHEVSCTEEQFQCSSLAQCVPLVSRCDGTRDCPDWSDETSCVCADFLSTAQMCDGVRDCRDGSDEDNCGLCQEDQYRCSLSQQCIPESRVCDTVPDCLLEEDERYCTALTTTDYISVDSQGDPVPKHEGILLFREQGTWTPICVSGLPASLASRICRYMGFNPDSHSLVSSDHFPSGPVPEARSEEDCQHVVVSCQEERCGLRPLYRNLQPSQSLPPAGPAHWPWQATFFVEGEVRCGGQVVDSSFILTDLDCAKLLVAGGSRSFITVLVGQDRRTEVGLGPHSQVSRVVSLKVTSNSTVVLAQLQTPLTLSEHVNKLCLATYDSSFTSCVISGSDSSSYTRTVSTSVSWCGDQLCLTPDSEDEEVALWSGVLVCQSSASLYQAVAVYSNPTRAAPLTDLAGLLGLLTTPGPAPVITDQCQGFRCGLGACISEDRVCDRQWDCQEGEDELHCPDITATSLPVCARHHQDPDHCLCPPTTRRCDNNLCLGETYWCNGVSECGDTSDEPAQCATCLGRLALTQPHRLCDGIKDCPDFADELPEACGCPEGSWRCHHPGLNNNNINDEDRGLCIDESEVCDGHNNCPSGADEVATQCIALSSSQDITQDIFLSPLSSIEGSLRVRTYGIWYTYCAPAWDSMAATAICRALGFQESKEWSSSGQQQAAHISPDTDLTPVNCSTVNIQCIAT